MKLLHVITTATGGDGITEVVRNLYTNIDRSRFAVSLCCLTEKGNLADAFEGMGVRVLSMDAKNSSSPIYLPRNLYALYKLARLLKKERFDILHTHEFFAGTIGRVAGWLAGVPVIVLTEHNTHFWKRKPHILVDRWLARVTGKIIANSESVKSFTAEQEGISEKKFEVIYNGINLARFEGGGKEDGLRKEFGIRSDELIVGTVGWLREQKGQRYLIEAAKIIREQRKDVRILIVGGEVADPAESVKDELYKLREDMDLTDAVTFVTGFRKDLPQVMAGFDIFVLPSLFEGFGLVAAEAMAASKPVVASRIPALSEVVEDGKTGVLTSPKDSRAIAEAVLELAGSPEKARAMGKAGRKRVEDMFSAEMMTRKHEALYVSLSEAKAPKSA